MINVLITGGTGYVGGRLCEYLSRFNECKVYVATRNKNFYKNSKIKYVEVDWNNNSSIQNACYKMDTIIHLAGMNSKDSSSDLNNAVKVNVGNTIKLLNVLTKSSVKKFIYISTIHVYGDALNNKISETSTLNPSGNYALTRVMAENEIKKFSFKNNVTTIILRLSNAFGKPHNKDVNCWNLLFNDLCKQVVTKNQMILKSSGQQYRNFIPLSDLCAIIHYFIKNDTFKELYNVFNLGSYFTAKIIDIAELIRSRCIKVFKMKQIKIKFEKNDFEKTTEHFEYDISQLQKIYNNFTFDHHNEIDELINFCFDNF